MNSTLSLALAMAASSTSLWRGTSIRHKESQHERPQHLLELYDMEGCPFCKIVREAMTELDLDVKILPCPKGGSLYRDEVVKMGGKAQFPFLVDPNTGVEMYESEAIIDYLFATYGSGKTPLVWRASLLTKATSMASSLFRPGLGLRKRASKQAEAALELYSFESSPYSKPVRERLTELELPYIVHNLGKYSASDWIIPVVREPLLGTLPPTGPTRSYLLETKGKLQVPFLIDPNTGMEMFESEAILDYLDQEYGA